MQEKLRVAVTGSSGYLAQGLLAKLKEDPRVEFILGLDVKPPTLGLETEFIQWDVRYDSRKLAEVLKKYDIKVVLHLAWMFNPQHDEQTTKEIDILGTQNVFLACQLAGVRRVVYTSSTTAYGPWPDNTESPVNEDYPRRGHPTYQYSRDKAIVDNWVLNFIKTSAMEFIILRAAIVFGPHTNNIVTYVAELPVMFRVLGYDPPMQYVSEEDMGKILYEAIVRYGLHGVYNVSGDGVLRYSEICKLTGKPTLALPAWVLYPAVTLLWKLRLLKFPAGLLDFIRYPWVADTARLKNYFMFVPRKTSREAFLEYVNRRK
ncbi:MAG: hypothetical protein A3I26_00845 [Candidatus Yanofskybacteria bacterium RIFCSPLOWO2_02_FULL_43_10]|uniref:NAD-dependent epimerase/dehydratase domain-containing protein n=1 Tax=Candidatus Yanofskybacteria bacterium RIFCSPLOWO2_12_FULL_43_11b TaxID=1802710 RepID=A0A1F8H9K8_9BACT|nr:MAG: hypothetical protein A2742_03025 [Candidatus Yanofskybacteria bacterium RIFCSPHIGHO2_01_FULL_43_32]OGN11435.1 MAG: hypothetical protein A3C69_01125 [Candidatus Yanofskybacteria bacterium RIFCSPHIGHO2_02_FULL_43_12]OGN17460.1 MAG: hypothetical protein A3E34_02070 [Candidatus Yanofskybacteria bacterium RIFCSPHIGHO2_12_FULL_43_11]OGN24915.1 MAG: hypothetical protein A2923_02795 [Candidatus Yanofskybacteria bacterium RIFCSPLOWO2_01_FULL_43_46]OGN29347.1 MAG: hypothetical protein A3I26_00845